MKSNNMIDKYYKVIILKLTELRYNCTTLWLILKKLEFVNKVLYDNIAIRIKDSQESRKYLEYRISEYPWIFNTQM